MTRRTGPIALEYSSVGVAKLTFDSMRVVILFAIGVAISVVVATVYFEGAAARVEDWIAACALYAWGESAAVLLAIKIRGRIVELDPVGRPSWANVLGGIVYTLLLFVIIFNTTARRRFPLGLDKGGSFLVAVGLALLAAAAIAIVLTPRKRG